MILPDTKERDLYLPASGLGTKAVSSDIEVYIFNSQIKKSTGVWQPTIFVVYDEPLPVISGDNTKAFDSSDQSVDGWLSLIKEELYANPSVEDIFVSVEGSDVDVWVVIPERDLAILHQIVEKEWELLRTLVSGESPAFLVDFHIIYRCGRNIEDLAPTRAIRLQRQVQ